MGGGAGIWVFKQHVTSGAMSNALVVLELLNRLRAQNPPCKHGGLLWVVVEIDKTPLKRTAIPQHVTEAFFPSHNPSSEPPQIAEIT